MIAWRTTSVIGIGVSSDAVRALVLAGGNRIVWIGERAVSEESLLSETLRSLIAEAPVSASTRRLAVAVGPSFAQLRLLHGLPAVKDSRTLLAIVQQSAGRHFRQNGIPVVTTPIAERVGTRGWAGAIEAPIVEGVAEFCRANGRITASLVPTAALLGSIHPDGDLSWHDGEIALELRFECGRLRDCRCLPLAMARAAHADGLTIDATLRLLGDDALRFVDAYAAARAGAKNPLALWPGRELARERQARRRMVIATVVLAVACLFSTLAPVAAAARAERRAARQMPMLEIAARAAQRTERALADSAKLLSQLVAFQRSTISKTLLLASLTCAVEEPTVFVSLRLEPSGGTLTALTPSAAALLQMLGTIPEIEGPAIMGSVTPETPAAPQVMMGAPVPPQRDAANDPLQRVTVHFQWRQGGPARVTTPRCAE